MAKTKTKKIKKRNNSQKIKIKLRDKSIVFKFENRFDSKTRANC